MQTIDWDDDNVPPLISAMADDQVQFLDYPGLHAFQVGDQIRYFTEVGVSCYRVVDVQPEYDLDPDIQEMTRVTIQGV